MGRMLPAHLRVLTELDAHSEPGGEFCVNFKSLSRWCEMDLAAVRRITRRLARNGFAEYHRGLWSDEGPAGAGYCITPAGRDAALRNAGPSP